MVTLKPVINHFSSPETEWEGGALSLNDREQVWGRIEARHQQIVGQEWLMRGDDWFRDQASQATWGLQGLRSAQA